MAELRVLRVRALCVQGLRGPALRGRGDRRVPSARPEVSFLPARPDRRAPGARHRSHLEKLAPV